ncbi:hypothetical protein ACNHKD_03650 [Methylocystis sp. JAN1]|uniref:tyrosine-protein kinase domain-containing protein n=1 Tax=Methylocystis sp. JAN1 TaxID=3397211 RepID=UPI003FA247B9
MLNVINKDLFPIAVDPGQLPPHEQPAQVQQLFAILRMRKWTILLFSLTGFALALAAGLLIPIKYMSSGFLVIDPEKWPKAATFNEVADRPESVAARQENSIDPIMDTHELALTSPALVERAAKETLGYKVGKGQPSLTPELLTPQPFGLDEIKRRFRVWARMLKPEQDGAADPKQLSKILKVIREKHSYVFVINAFADTPQKAADFANRVMSLYVAERAEARRVRITEELDQISRRITALNQIVNSTTSEARSMLTHPIQRNAFFDQRLRETIGDASATRSLVPALERRQTYLRGQLQNLKPDAEVMSPAAPPSAPSTPHPILFGVPGLILSLIGGCAWAIWRERADTSLRSENDVEEKLRLPLIGFLPEQRRGARSPEQLLLSDPNGSLFEAVRFILSSMNATQRETAPRSVLVTSSVSGEGKTTLARCLAIAGARMGRRTLLVDLDFTRRQRIGVADSFSHQKSLALPSEELSSPLLHVQGLADLRIDFLQIAPSVAEPLALFANHQLAKTMRDLHNEYDWIIVDGSPLMELPEAHLIPAFVDKVMFVARWGRTRADVVVNALKKLRPYDGVNKSDIISGVVLTRADMKKHASYGYGDVGEMLAALPRFGRRR